MNLRKHQERGKRRAEAVVVGAIDCPIFVDSDCGRKLGPFAGSIAHVTPGGGKTLLASIFAHAMLDAGFVDQVVIVCPRDSLRSQMVDGWSVESLGLSSKTEIWDPHASKQKRLFGGFVGVVTTYQSAVAHPNRLLKLIEGRRTLLVLDEVHHLAGPDEDDDSEEYGQWKTAIDPLVLAARHTFAMTGTLYRSDGQRIPYVKYDNDDKPQADIRYTRQDALDEGAVLPIEFRLWDGDAKFEWRGEEVKTLLSDASGDDARRALRTALLDLRSPSRNEAKGYVYRFLENALGEWNEYRRNVYPSKAIVVCDSQIMARWVCERIHEMGYDPTLAISDEPDSAKRIRRFRKGVGGDVLVTVGMAYEGLDVPSATHLIVLTKRRARPWLEQAVARVTRINNAAGVPNERQFAYVYIANDRRAQVFIDEMLAEQEQSVPLKKRLQGVGTPRGKSSFIPGICEPTDRLEGSDIAGRLTKEESRKVEAWRSCFPEVAHVPARQLLERIILIERRPTNAG